MYCMSSCHNKLFPISDGDCINCLYKQKENTLPFAVYSNRKISLLMEKIFFSYKKSSSLFTKEDIKIYHQRKEI